MRNEPKRCVKFKQNAKKDNKSSHILIVPQPNDDMQWNQDKKKKSYLMLYSSSCLPFNPIYMHMLHIGSYDEAK